jgi:poly(hydroxyalkanoate) depolymerase family esterase
MSRLAEAEGLAVLYPAQDGNANSTRCWNWFRREDQQRDAGEPSILAGMTRQVVREHGLDPSRLYVAGMSAGGAASAVLAATYPDLFAAVGIHSGLPYRAAHDMPSAFAAMRDGGPVPPVRGRFVPMIVMHGDQDTTVSPLNGDRIVAQARTRAAGGLLQPTAATEHGRSAGGIGYTRTVHSDRAGRPMIEQWRLHGLGHAWSGGGPDGSFTDPRGPDASRAMLRFFLQHARPGSG